MSEFLRIARASLLYHDFLSKAKELFNRMLNQTGNKNMILLQLKKTFINHADIFERYHKSYRDILNEIDR